MTLNRDGMFIHEKLFALWLDFGKVTTYPSSISWLALLGGGEQCLIHPSIRRAGHASAYIYNPELLSSLALLSVSQGLSACSPSAASSFCADQLLH